MAGLINNAVEQPDCSWQSEIRLIRAGRPRTLMVRVVAGSLQGEVLGYVVTFDDITALVMAERRGPTSPDASPMRSRIPLTPIQLASERLKRKYSREIKSDPDTFVACTETIIRQVEDIGRMVDEFSSFARMPRPELKLENLNELCARRCSWSATDFQAFASTWTSLNSHWSYVRQPPGFAGPDQHS